MRSEPLVVPIKISEKKENTNSDKQLPNIPQSLTKTNTIIKITPNGKTVTPPKIEVKNINIISHYQIFQQLEVYQLMQSNHIQSQNPIEKVILNCCPNLIFIMAN